MSTYDPFAGGYASKDMPLSDRVEAHFRNLSLSLQDPQGMMRHILDCLGALKVRLEDPDIVVAPFLIRIFADSVRVVMDHITSFDPIDNESAVKFLLQSFPDDSKRGDGRTWLPVHWAAANHNTEAEHMKALISERPIQLIKGHQHFEESPLQQQDQYTEAFSGLKPRDLYHNPNVPRDYKGLLPLHLCCSLRHCRIENVKQMIAAQPISLQCPDHRGWLPIHWCAYNNRHVDVLQLLVTNYPDGCFEANKKGKLPFQLAAYNRYTFMMDILYQENPEAIDAMDYNGNTPLHDAAKSLNSEGVKKILSYKSDLNRVRNFKEELPIHKVFSFFPTEDSNHSTLEQMEQSELHGTHSQQADGRRAKAPRRLFARQLETVKALLSVNPEVAALPDRNDSLPLHLAVFHNSPYEVVEYIYNVYPSAALLKDNAGKLPIQYATHAAVKKLLMKSSPPLVKAGLTDTFSRFIM